MLPARAKILPFRASSSWQAGFPRSLARFLGVLKTRDTYEVSTSEVRARHVDVAHKVCRRYVGVNDTCQVRELACVKHVREDVPGTY